MLFRYANKIVFLFIMALLFACADKPQEVKIDVSATFNGQPLANAAVRIDDNNSGQTDERGRFHTVIMRKTNTTINLAVDKPMPGYRTQAWSKQVTFDEKSGDAFALIADVKGTPFITIKAMDGKTPVKDAKILFGKEQIGKTDDKGEFVYDLPNVDKEKHTIKVSKYGYETFKKQLLLEPGATIETNIPRQLILRVTALSEHLTETMKLKGAQVFLGNKIIGKTNDDGILRIVRKGLNGKNAQLTVKVPGYLPASWTTDIKLVGNIKLQHYFYPKDPEPTRVSLFRFVSNTSGEDIGTIPHRFQESLAKRISSIHGFTMVDSEKMMELFRQSKLTPDEAMEKGWRNTSLHNDVDVIGFGSVTKDLKGRYIVEAKFYDADGKVAFSQIATAKNPDRIDRAAKEIVLNMKESFPIVGHVIDQKDKMYHINLGDDHFPIEDKNEFTVFNPSFDKEGRITGYTQVGGLVIDDTKNNYSVGKIDGFKKGLKPEILARVVRANMLDSNNQHFVTISAKSDIRGNIQALSGVNIYLNEKWMGATGKDGKARIPVRLDKSYDLSLYRHGFSQKAAELEVAKNAELREFMLDSYYSLLKIESEPSNATVYIDGKEVGKTPMSDGTSVPTGFHTVRLTAGGDFRDYEEVIEFNAGDVNWTGDSAIYFHKDLLAMGDRAYQAGRIDDAIAIYSQADKDHPDYAQIHHNLAQLYLDNKKDPDAAIKEFEKVVAIPEIRELIFKQFSIAYTNLGHAYHEKAEQILHSNTREAASYLAKSIKTLNKAKENARFFPNEYYDEAVHDTYYYIALSYQKLYQLSKKPAILSQTERAWRDYIDFFPQKLMKDKNYADARESADTFMEQLKN